MAIEVRNGRPIYYRYEQDRKIYVASGELALLAAERDAQRRSELAAARRKIAQRHAEIDASRMPLNAFTAALESMHAAVLVDAGCHRQYRGPWRMKRDQTS